MKFSTVKILQKLFQLSGRVHVFEVGEKIHVPERIDGNERQVRLAFAEMMKRMSEAITVGNEEIDVC